MKFSLCFSYLALPSGLYMIIKFSQGHHKQDNSFVPQHNYRNSSEFMNGEPQLNTMSKHKSIPPLEMTREEMKMKANGEASMHRSRFTQQEMHRNYSQRMPDNPHAKAEYMARSSSGQGYMRNMDYSMHHKYDYERHHHQMRAEHDRKLNQM
jgi:hypothetical protein